MDLLKSLHLEDLPEQQTRTSHLTKDHPNFDLKLGFDACCTCGKASPTYECNGCHRVLYCSKECQIKDSNPTTASSHGNNNNNNNNSDDEDDNYNDHDDDLEEQEQALGHSSVVCALLALCNDDDEADENILSSRKKKDHQHELLDGKNDKNKSKNKNKNNSNNKKKRQQAAMDRIASEFESYPATLANVIMEGPCYSQVLNNCKQRQQQKQQKSLTIHVIGASLDSELWEGHPDQEEEQNVFRNYADALAEIADSYSLKSIRLDFIGPECPKVPMVGTESISSITTMHSSNNNTAKKSENSSSSCKLQYQTIQGEYNKKLFHKNNQNIEKPDIVVFFNPGFTCPDYDWKEALMAIDNGIPCLITTNTELEGVADAQYLLDNHFIKELPPSLLGMIMAEEDEEGNDKDEDEDEDHYNKSQDDDNGTSSFFSLNPYCGMRVRQSGTMANDLYVKNRWMFGVVIDSGSNTTAATTTSSSFGGATKKRKIEGSGNTKKKNPALI